MVRVLMVLGLAAGLAWAGAAQADVVRTFAASGSFDDGSILGGTVAIDITTGGIAGGTVFFTGASDITFDFLGPDGGLNGGTVIHGSNRTAYEGSLFLVIPQTSLVGYGGGVLSRDSSYQLFDLFSENTPLVIRIVSGSLTPVAETPVPEPGSIAVLGVGLLGLMAALRRRVVADRSSTCLARTRSATYAGPT